MAPPSESIFLHGSLTTRVKTATHAVLLGFHASPMPNPGTKNAKLEVLFTVSRKFKCQTVNTIDKILMPNSK